MKIVHISDVHWRPIARHSEYTKAFELFFKQMKDVKPDLIVNAGDTVHNKTLVSPELFDKLAWFFDECCKIAPMITIIGNHDLALTNKERQDSLSPVVNALKNPNCFLYKNSGIYHHQIKGLNVAFSVFSLCDKPAWTSLKPDPNADVNIALFHGTVVNSKTDLDWVMKHGEEYGNDRQVTTDFFKDYDFAMLGDIHKQQNLDYRTVDIQTVNKNELLSLQNNPNIEIEIIEEINE